MKKVISLITDKGLEYFEQVAIEDLESLSNGTRVFIHTGDHKEHLGLYIGFSRNRQSLNLKAIDDSVIIRISTDRIAEIFKEIKSDE